MTSVQEPEVLSTLPEDLLQEGVTSEVHNPWYDGGTQAKVSESSVVTTRSPSVSVASPTRIGSHSVVLDEIPKRLT